MRIWQSSQQATTFPIPLTGLSHLLAAITNDDQTQLPQAILNLIRHEVDVSNCALFLVPPSGKPVVLGHAEAKRPIKVSTAWNAYIEQYYQRDIALQQILRGNTADRTPHSPILLHQSANDIADPAYRRACYDDVGTVQRFAIFRHLKDKHSLFIGIYRPEAAKVLSNTDLHYLEMMADCLSEAVIQRYRAMPHTAALSMGKLDQLQASLAVKLSRREYDLILCIANGMTVPAAAASMGITTTSAITYRNRGFAKLNISTQQELFSKLMGYSPALS